MVRPNPRWLDSEAGARTNKPAYWEKYNELAEEVIVSDDFLCHLRAICPFMMFTIQGLWFLPEALSH
ncbi:hypothetical protein DESC_370055 [Desulfosarcina cetonica]|nr:hypothetical protein DESC_370055 [Desulfosarcina cetonica]